MINTGQGMYAKNKTENEFWRRWVRGPFRTHQQALKSALDYECETGDKAIVKRLDPSIDVILGYRYYVWTK